MAAWPCSTKGSHHSGIHSATAAAANSAQDLLGGTFVCRPSLFYGPPASAWVQPPQSPPAPCPSMRREALLFRRAQPVPGRRGFLRGWRRRAPPRRFFLLLGTQHL